VTQLWTFTKTTGRDQKGAYVADFMEILHALLGKTNKSLLAPSYS